MPSAPSPRTPDHCPNECFPVFLGTASRPQGLRSLHTSQAFWPHGSPGTPGCIRRSPTHKTARTDGSERERLRSFSECIGLSVIEPFKPQSECTANTFILATSVAK